MPHRAIVLRVMFISLAVTACFGAVGVFFTLDEVRELVITTSGVTAVVCFLLFVVAMKLEKQSTRPGALLALALLALEYLLALGWIWESRFVFLSHHLGESLGMVMLDIAVTGVPAITFMRMARETRFAWAGRVGLALAAIQLSLLLFLTRAPEELVTKWNLLEVSLSFAPFALLSLICLEGVGAPPHRHWRWLGVIAAAVGYGLMVHEVREPASRFHYAYYALCIAAATAHANILFESDLPRKRIWLRWATLGAGIATAILCAIYIHSDESDLIDRLIDAVMILTGCGTVAVLVLARLNHREEARGKAIAGLTRITMTCPQCSQRQTVPPGTSRCGECGVVISLRVEEPQCPVCGYSLLRLRSEICPECGTRVPAIGPIIAPSNETSSQMLTECENEATAPQA